MDADKYITETHNTKNYPLDYKLLEWQLIINRELYEDKTIDLKIYSTVEKNILEKMNRIRKEIIS